MNLRSRADRGLCKRMVCRNLRISATSGLCAHRHHAIGARTIRMSSRISARRLGQSALATLLPRSKLWLPCTSLPGATQRNKSNATASRTARRRNSTPPKSKARGEVEQPTAVAKPKHDAKDLDNPLLESYLKGNLAGKKSFRPQVRTGGKSTNPLFDEKRHIPGWEPSLTREKKAELEKKMQDEERAAKAAEDKKLLEFNLDPDIRLRRRLERGLVLKGVKRHGRLTKADRLARTERQCLWKSQDLPTSTKKMQKVVNQLAGKTVSEALVQLRFSPKRIARDVMKGLELAQNEAIVYRGMGLGGGKLAQKRWEAQRSQSELSSRDISLAVASQKPRSPTEQLGRPVHIELKDGSRKVVRDPSEIYIDQAWVGKGEMWKGIEQRARGRINTLRHRTTSVSFLLKEEKTRMRISEEIKKKRDNRKLWVALPDRPITSQRQYCLW
ncbi:hypothetical protein BDU57DRAFT_512039 [Ampelomyces quisqualis]|uniref:Ribosomal protein L22/L17 n=1 Tax=Ampelomyces quisqualis TaxID=50730 RepID=A0A6A5QWZ3_AMPQU|nr:hypothetical protein BDU57DRAFT_512039 [Ampelomyces quisqualis]